MGFRRWHHLEPRRRPHPTTPSLDKARSLQSPPEAPEFVAVGARNMAWYSTDGSDWFAGQSSAAPRRTIRFSRALWIEVVQDVEMEGIAVSGRNLAPRGKSIWVHEDGSATFVPVFWTSTDGLHGQSSRFRFSGTIRM